MLQTACHTRDNFTWKRETTHAIGSFAIEKKSNCKSLESSTVTGSTIYLRNIQMYLRNVFCFSGDENTWLYSKLGNTSTGDSINKKKIVMKSGSQLWINFTCVNEPGFIFKLSKISLRKNICLSDCPKTESIFALSIRVPRFAY